MMTSLLNKQTYFRDCFVGIYPIVLIVDEVYDFVRGSCMCLKYPRSWTIALEVSLLFLELKS